MQVNQLGYRAWNDHTSTCIVHCLLFMVRFIVSQLVGQRMRGPYFTAHAVAPPGPARLRQYGLTGFMPPAAFHDVRVALFCLVFLTERCASLCLQSFLFARKALEPYPTPYVPVSKHDVWIRRSSRTKFPCHFCVRGFTGC